MMPDSFVLLVRSISEGVKRSEAMGREGGTPCDSCLDLAT